MRSASLYHHPINSRYSFIYFIIFSLLISCTKTQEKANDTDDTVASNTLIKYAKGFDIQVFDTYKKLIIKSPYPGAKNYQEFILVNPKSENKDVKGKRNTITIPLKKIVATSTTHIPMLELIQEENSLIGFPHMDYISSAKTNQRVKNGFITEIGNEQDFNTEILISLQPDAVIGFTMGNTTRMYNVIEKNGIPVIFDGEWLEETPLGRAEWIKFFGVLFNKDKEADSIFKKIEFEYNNAKQIALKANDKPSILTGVMFKDKWNLPAGKSFTAQLFKDANTNYLWKNTNGQGSLILSFESVFDKAKNADFWIGSGYFTSLDDLANSNKHYTQFKSFKEKEIYTFSKKRGENDGVIYFELAPVQPHIVLQDLIKICHPELLPDYQSFFLERIN